MGIGLFYFLPYRAYLLFTAIMLSVIISSALTAIFFYRKANLYQYKGFIGVLCILLFFFLGAFICLLNKERLNPKHFANRHYSHLKIWVNDEPQQRGNILRFKAKVIAGYADFKQFKALGRLLVSVRLDSLNPLKLKYGDEIIVPAQYAEIEPPYNPAEFDFKAWLATQNIYHQTFADQKNILITGRHAGYTIIKAALSLREKQIHKFRELIKSDEAFTVASTLILGYRADLSQETLTAYANTGTLHALSVSGAHVAIIYVVLDFILLFLNRNRKLKIAKLLIICSLIWGYALITGLSPSVVRSAIMISVFIIAKTLSKNTNNYNILAFSAFCQLTYNPFSIWDVGFQLSYLAVFGLFYLQPKIYNLFYIENRWLDKLWNFIAMSLAAQIATFPLSIYYFHQFPIYFLIGNLFITLPLVLMMYLGIAVLIPGLSFLAGIFEWLINFTNLALKWIAHLPFATFSSIYTNLAEFILLSSSLGLFIYGLTKFSKRFILSSLSLFVCYQLHIAYDSLRASKQRNIIFFSLRKNYAAAFTDGKETVLVTDLKETDKSYIFFIKPALMSMQINRTHFISLKKDTVLHNFILKDMQLTFHEYRMLVIDNHLNRKKLQGSGFFSALWFTANNKFDLSSIPPGIRYQTVLIDATNKDYRIKQLQKNAKDAYVLKKNKAYLVQLTQ